MAWVRSKLNTRSINYQDSDQPSKRRLVASMLPIGYEDADGQVQQIDFTPQRVQVTGFNGWRVTANGWHYGIETNGTNWFGGRRGKHFFKFRLTNIGYTQVDNASTLNFAQDFTDIGGAPTYNVNNLSYTPRVVSLPDGDITAGNLVEWRDLWPALPAGEIYARWAVDAGRLKEEIVITQAAREWIVVNRPPSYYGLTASQSWLTLGFRIDWTDIPKRLRDGVNFSESLDFSDALGAVEARDALDELLFYMPIDYAYAGEGEQRQAVRLRKRFWRNADGQWYLVVGARISDLASLPAGDLVFDPTLNSDVAAGSDDAIYWFGYNDTDDYIVVGMAEPGIGTNAGAGWRFDNIALSGSDTIDSVYVTMVATVNQWGQMDNRWTFENSDDAATFSSGSIPGSRPIVATIVADSSNFNHIAGTAYNYPYASSDQDSLAAALQSVIDRAGWASGNAVALINQSGQDASVQYGYARIPHATYNHTTHAAPQLVINYTAGAPAGVSVDLSAAPVAVGFTTAAPTARAGSLALTPAAVGAGLGVAPASVELGDLLLVIAAAQMGLGVSPVTVAQGSISIALNPTGYGLGVATPTSVQGSILLNLSPTGVGLTTGAVTFAAGSLTLTPAPVAVGFTTGAVSVLGGGLTVTLTAVQGGFAVASPVVVAGSLNLTPAAAGLGWATQAPTISIVGGGTLVTLSGAALGLATGPLTAVSGSLLVSLGAAATGAAVGTPSVSITGGGTTVTLLPAGAGFAVSAPTSVLSSLGLNLGVIGLGLGVNNPAVSADGDLTLLLAPVALNWLVKAPSSVLGSVQVQTGTVAYGNAVRPPQSVLGALSLTPAPATVGVAVQAPAVGLSSLNVLLVPVGAGWTILVPGVRVGSAIRTNPRTAIAVGIRNTLAADGDLVAALTEDGMFKVFLGIAPGTAQMPYVLISHIYGGQLYRTPRPELDALWSVRAISNSQVEAENIHRLIYYALDGARPEFADEWYADQDINYNGPHNDLDASQGVQHWAFGGYYRVRAVKNRY